MSDFVVFNKLRRAIEFCKSTDGTFVFSWELNDRGCRRFLVSSKKSFWSRYKKDNDKNCYEVIISGSVSKLYFYSYIKFVPPVFALTLLAWV